ncbi:MAG: hypothetical protein ACI9YE_001391 [Psychroserpens sp.]|jgi:hypothetical protein
MDAQLVQDLGNVGLGILASVLFKILELMWSWAVREYRKKRGDFFFTFKAIDIHLTLSGLTLALSLLLTSLSIISQTSAITVIALLVINSLWTIYSRMRKLQLSGIIGIDEKIETGLDYKSALKLVRSDLMFLGTGGHKLTQLGAEFENVIASSSQNRPVKFLLCHPDSEALVEMAKQAKKDVDEYKNNVLVSLRTIYKHIDIGRNVEVRFYKADKVAEMPIFRLMFFNRNYCLCSYNIFGEGKRKGERTPQLHLYEHENEDGTGSFHIAFSRYFDRLWNQSDVYKIEDVLAGRGTQG